MRRKPPTVATNPALCKVTMWKPVPVSTRDYDFRMQRYQCPEPIEDREHGLCKRHAADRVRLLLNA